MAGASNFRFIPAPAGNTMAGRTSRRMISVHPRACGEHRGRNSFSRQYTGSSPRLRGTHGRRIESAEIYRFIPAPAGNTLPAASTLTAKPVHPRACGEHSAISSCIVRSCGSSPRLRGTRAELRPARRLSRFIPAPAGNTRRQDGGPDAAAVHPRACGEHSRLPLPTCTNCGSSPRLRGTRSTTARSSNSSRFIPAPAGNTAFSRSITGSPPVHPRACGEHTSA